MTGDRSIVVERLTRRFADLAAVDAVDLEVPAGRIFGFLGPNGAGKSTLVKVLATILAPSEGRATVAGFDVTTRSADVRASVGVALQDVGLDPLMTGRELLVLQARLFGTGAAEARRQADRLMETVGLDDVPPKKRVGDYSGGMKRRLDLALALVHDPGILFLDEPTTGLDPISRAAIWEEVRRLNRERAVTIFLTTQYLEEADRLADDVAIIDKGRIVLQGSPAELKRDVGSETVKLTFADADAARRADQALREMGRRRHLADRELTLYFAAAADVIPDVVRLLDGAGIQLHGVEVSQPTLDDVFLQATGVRLGDRDGATSATDADGSASAAAADRETSAVDADGAAGAADTDGPAADGGRAASRSPAREEVRP